MVDNAYQFVFDRADGSSKIKLNDYQEHVLMIVNTASLCGFTKQYTELEQVWQKYRDQGLVIIAVPANNFGQQEPSTNEEIVNFCLTKFSISFPIAAKTDVIGINSHPFFNWTRQRFGLLSGPKWNFYKYLINRNGELVEWFSSFSSPSSAKISNAIEKYLA
jgi:glutathione peroxidase